MATMMDSGIRMHSWQKCIDVLRKFSKGQDDSGRVTIAIRSAFFGSYLRMEYHPDSVEGASGVGRVSSSSYVGLWEMFRLVPQSDGTVAIQSVVFDSWLRMDAGSIEEEPTQGGVVNCQSFVGSMERFHIVSQEDGTVAIQSAQFGTYLRMDSIGIAWHPSGGGVVNCSKELRSWEKFVIEVIHPMFGIKSVSSHLYLRMDCHQAHSDAHERNDVSGQCYLGEWEKFEFTWQEDRSVGIRSRSFGKYLSLQDNGTRVGCSSTLEFSAKFTIVLHSDGSLSFKSVEHNLYLSMASSSEVSSSTSISPSEKFEIVLEC